MLPTYMCIISKTVVLNIVRIKDVVNVFGGIGDEDLWAQDRALWYTTVHVEDKKLRQNCDKSSVVIQHNCRQKLKV